MNENNPYAAPEADNVSTLPTQREYQQLDDKAFNKFYYRSCNVSAIGFLILLAVLILGGSAVFMLNTEGAIAAYTNLAIAAVQLIVFIGIVSRAAWGRIAGIVGCSLMLINIPLGTIIGIAGLIAFVKCPELFGEGRVTHKELKAEFNKRKAEKKAAKKQAKLERKAAKRNAA